MSLFDPFPTLQTPRLTLRALTPEDLDAIFRIQSDPVVTKYFGRPADSTPADTQKRLDLVFEGVRTGTAIRWGLTLRGSDELMGSTGFWRWNKDHRWAEIGYELAAAYWGKGYMTEAHMATLRYGFDVMGLNRVEANVDPENKASIRVLEKLGFVREALLREHWYYQGLFTDTATYGLLRRDFERLSAKEAGA